jgi:hypothetical protein
MLQERALGKYLTRLRCRIPAHQSHPSVVLDATGHLHEQVAAVRERIRTLHSALVNAHAAHSSQPHPLLIGTSDGLAEDYGRAAYDRHVDGLPSPQGVFSPGGATHIHGPTRSVAGFLSFPYSRLLMLSYQGQARLDPELLACIRHFPFPPSGLSTSDIVFRLKSHLPGFADASRLARDFFFYFGAMFSGISTPHVMESLLPHAYSTPTSPRDGSLCRSVDMDPHALGLLFGIFAIGSLANAPPSDRLSVARFYGQLGVAALGAVSIFERPSLVTVQAMHLCSSVETMCQTGGDESAGTYLSLACQLCCTVSSSAQSRPLFAL